MLVVPPSVSPPHQAKKEPAELQSQNLGTRQPAPRQRLRQSRRPSPYPESCGHLDLHTKAARRLGTDFYIPAPAIESPAIRDDSPASTGLLPTMPQPLNPKDQANFRAVVRAYEDKQYKRGIKTADSILKKNPKHGDTMAMKALILMAQGKTDEAFALAKVALTADMKSHICWHVYGLLYRQNKNFEEAIKAYKFALKLEPDTAQIQRDLAILQIHTRDFAGYIQTRQTMLQARPQLRQSWTALAIAHHLSGNLTEAENVLTTYEGTLKATPSRYDLEHSEAILYKNTLIAEQGDYQRALDHLNDAAKNSLDRLAVLEYRADYLSKLGRKEEAAKAYRVLIDRNPDHQDYYDKLIDVLGLGEDDVEARKAIYDEYAAKYPRCDAARRVPLTFLSGNISSLPLVSVRSFS